VKEEKPAEKAAPAPEAKPASVERSAVSFHAVSFRR
jgi:hypothetical protein